MLIAIRQAASPRSYPFLVPSHPFLLLLFGGRNCSSAATEPFTSRATNREIRPARCQSVYDASGSLAATSPLLLLFEVGQRVCWPRERELFVHQPQQVGELALAIANRLMIPVAPQRSNPSPISPLVVDVWGCCLAELIIGGRRVVRSPTTKQKEIDPAHC